MNLTNEHLYNHTTGTLLMQLKQDGVRDLEKISNAMHALRQQQLHEGIFTFDCFTDKGSHTYSNLTMQTDIPHRNCIIWSINHYLGLNRHPKVIAKAIQSLRDFGSGCGTSAISGGMNALHKQIERKLQHWLGIESIMLFPTGYTANMGLLAAICQAGDNVFIDDESHASIRDGIRLSPAKRWTTFKHNSISDLEKKLSSSISGKTIVVVESAYSMSGDICPLQKLAALKQQYDFILVVDEAHSFGLYGENGQGLCHRENIIDQVDFLTSTFSKATASIGGFVATKAKYVSYLQWSANAFAFQACFSPADAGAILASMEIIETTPTIANQLHSNNQYMREQLLASGFNLGYSQTPIIPIYIPDTKKLMRVCFDLFKNGIFSVPIAYPMVKQHEGRIRFIVNANHTKEQIDRTCLLLAELAAKYKLLPDQALSFSNI